MVVNNTSSPVPFDVPRYVSQQNAKLNQQPCSLFHLIQNGSWTEATEYVKKFPAEAAHWILKPDCDRTEWRHLPLHEACARLPTIQFIDAIIEAFPQAVKEPDHNGRLPIHHACCHGASVEVVEKLILENPKSLIELDVWGKDPLSVAQAGVGKHRDAIITMVSKGYDFYRDFKLKMKWEEEQVILRKNQETEAQKLVKVQEETIARLTRNSTEEYEQFELVQRRQKDTTTKLTKELKEAKETFSRISAQFEKDIATKQLNIAELNVIVQEKDERLRELEQRVEDLNADLIREISITGDLKDALKGKDQEIVSLKDALQEERKRSESLASSLAGLSLFVTHHNIEMDRQKEANNKLQQNFEEEKAALRLKCEETLKQCQYLTTMEASHKNSVDSLTVKLKIAMEENAKLWAQLANARKEHNSLVDDDTDDEDAKLDRLFLDVRAKVTSLATANTTTKNSSENDEADGKLMSLASKIETLEGLCAQLEAENNSFKIKIELLENDTHTLDLKRSSLEECLLEHKSNEALLKEQVEVANSNLISMRSKVASKETEFSSLQVALEEEKHQNQLLREELEVSSCQLAALETVVQSQKALPKEDEGSLKRQLHDARIKNDKIVSTLQKEKSELEFKVLNLEAAIRHMKREQQEEDDARNAAFDAFRNSMKDSGAEHIQKLSSLVNVPLKI